MSVVMSHGRRAVALAAAVCVAAAIVFAAGLARASVTKQPSGTFAYTTKLATECPIGAVVCTDVTFSGGLKGTGQFTILTLVPSSTPGVDFFTGRLAVHTADGDLSCDLDGALNTNTSSQGEFGEICPITAGTGAYSGATGHLRLFGTSTPGTAVLPAGGSGKYESTIIMP